MPVIVIGADTPLGGPVADALLGRQGEVRAFVTDPEVGIALKQRGAKVATGDVSDESHVAAASTGAFCAVLIPDAAYDERERSFAPDGETVLDGWVSAVAEAGVRRVVVLDSGGIEVPPRLRQLVREVAIVATAGRTDADVANEVAVLDDRAKI